MKIIVTALLGVMILSDIAQAAFCLDTGNTVYCGNKRQCRRLSNLINMSGQCFELNDQTGVGKNKPITQITDQYLDQKEKTKTKSH